MKLNWKNLLFWIFLILSIIFLIWYVFGSSPTEFIALLTIIFTVIMKMWHISDRQIRLEDDLKMWNRNIRDSFINVKGDLNLIKKRLKI